MQRNPHSYQIATGYRTFYSLSLIYQPITKKTIVFTIKTPLKLYILALFYTTELLEEEIRVMLFILIILKIEHLK